MPTGHARAADLPVNGTIKSVTDLPFFSVIDDRLTYSWIPNATAAGVYSIRPDGSINGTTAKQVYSFTHFDEWAYGTNFFNISMLKSDHNDPASPCTSPSTIVDPFTGFTPHAASCSGTSDYYGLFRSTVGWNQLFDTKAFTMGPLHNISFEVGMDAEAENSYFASAKRDVVAGLQFAFDLPYKGYFNVAPLLYYEFFNRNAFAQCGSAFAGSLPGATCLVDGERSFDPTWAVETNYYMNLGFLPENMQFWSISGRAAWYGKKGTENDPLPYSAPGNISTAVEFNSEPIRLTFDASKAVWGPRYTHLLDVWVAYRYWQNKLGLDAARSSVCNITPGASNNSCTEKSVYSGVTLKF